MMDDSAFRPDMTLPDMGLSKLNGHDACRRIRSEPWAKDIVFIVLTGWSQEESKRQSKEAGFNSYMVKPVDPHALAKLMAGLLQAPV